jgi:hypothetical protein
MKVFYELLQTVLLVCRKEGIRTKALEDNDCPSILVGLCDSERTFQRV